jgi:serine/threonine protein phosphatase PrpC
MPSRKPVPPRPAPDRPKEHASLDLEFAELSDLGRIRTNNEDSIGHALPESPAKARSHGWLFVLTDGVGGALQGEVASRIAVETIVTSYPKKSPIEPVGSVLAGLIKEANTRVHEAGIASGAAGAGMSTTVVACALRHDRAHVAHAGDSRCYLIRGRHIKSLTRDHTVANEQLRLGIVRGGGDNRHILSRSLGTELFVNPEVTDVALQAGDTLLLCSDGLHGAVPDTEIAQIVTGTPDLTGAARKLIERANLLDGGDNVTVQLIRVHRIERMGVYRGRPYQLK